MCFRNSLTDSWTTPSIYTASARPILSFPRSKTEKYTLWKTSPRIQVSVDELTLFSRKAVKQWPLKSWGSQRHTPVSMGPYQWLPPISRPSKIILFPIFSKYQGVFSAAWDVRVHPKPEGQDMRVSWGRMWWVEDWELGKQRNEKQQSPTVEHKELYSIFSDKSHEKE